jgi:hypothetical protein
MSGTEETLHTGNRSPLVIRVVRELRYPDGLGILMQFEHGHLVLSPRDALIVANGLQRAVADVERLARDGS